MTNKIGLIGTGMLGNAVGLHLLESGYLLTVYNRTRQKTLELEKNGAIIVDSPKEVAKSADLVITCVKDANAVKEVSFGKNGIIEGKHEQMLVADMSTVNPNDTKEISKKFKDAGIVTLDIPVVGGPRGAIKGELLVMVSGDENAFKRFKKIFETIGNRVFFLGKTGSAHAIKLAMNMQNVMHVLSLSEGITLARAASVDPELFLNILNSTYFKTGMSETKAYKMIKDEFEPAFTIKNVKKELNTINEAAKSFGISLPMITKAEEIYKKAIENGFGDLDYTGILAYLKHATKSDTL
jgi:3-hydroxyisobutyrate dehydrogenase